MDKKGKKRIEVLKTRLQKLRLQLAGARKQNDDPAEVAQLERDIAAAEAELERIKSS